MSNTPSSHLYIVNYIHWPYTILFRTKFSMNAFSLNVRLIIIILTCVIRVDATSLWPTMSWSLSCLCLAPSLKPPHHLQSSYERVSRGPRWSDPAPDGVHSRQQPNGQPGPPDVQAGQGKPGGSLVTGSQTPAWGTRYTSEAWTPTITTPL